MSDEMKTGYKVIKVNGRDAWLFADGTIVPRICGGTEDPPKDPPADPPKDPVKVEFSKEQQDHIDGMFNKKFAEVHTKAEAKAQTEIDGLKAEIETLKATKKPDEKQKTGNEDLTALQDKIAVLEADKTKGFQIKSESNIIAEASGLKAINAHQVYDLIKSQINIDTDGKRTVVNSEGQPRISEGGQPMTEKELVVEFLTANQHHVQASGKVGSGSQTPGFGESQNEDLMKLPAVERLTAVRAAKAAQK